MDKRSVQLDLRLVTVILLIVIGVMAFTGRPWEALGLGKQRTITVSGKGTVTAAPDQFVFTATYQKKAATSQEATSQVSEVGNRVIAKLKELGLKSNQIKNQVSSYENYEVRPLTDPATPTEKKSEGYVASYAITATLTDLDLAKKVQEYLASTPVVSSVSPMSSFSKGKETTIENEARAKAVADAKGKAQTMATELGVKLGKVVSISDLSQYGGPVLLEKGMAASAATDSSASSTPLLEPGDSDLDFSVSVVYQIR